MGATALALCGCVSTTDLVVQRENLLAAAGFSIRPADTPQARAEMAKYPPGHFVRVVENGRLMFLFPDPAVCGCTYAGDEAAWQRYQFDRYQQGLVQQQAEAAQMNLLMSQQIGFGIGPFGYGW